MICNLFEDCSMLYPKTKKRDKTICLSFFDIFALPLFVSQYY